MKLGALAGACRGRAIEACAASGRTWSHHGGCRVPGCRGRTTGEKPFCIDHLLRMTYAASVAAEWDRVANQVWRRLLT